MKNVLQAIAAFLSKWTPAVVALTAVAAYFAPGAFGWVRGNAQTSLLGLIMLTMGLTLTDEDFRVLASRPFDIVVGSLAQFTLMPLIAYGLVRGLGLPREVGVGLILVGCCPGGVSSNIMSFLCKGDVAFSVGLTTVSTLASPVMTSILFVTILPVALGFLLNSAFGARTWFGEVKKVLPGVAVAGLACIVGGVVSAHGQKFMRSGVLIFVAVFCHNALGYALGYASGMLARFPRAKLRTVSIEVGMQNAGLATVLADKHFPLMPEAAIASAVSCAWHSISGALLAGIFNWADDLAARLRRKALRPASH